MIRKSLIVVLTLASVATTVLWIDSYRTRRPKSLTPEQQAVLQSLLRSSSVDYFGPPDPLARIGLTLDQYIGGFNNRMIFRVRCCVGSINLRLDTSIETGARVPPIDIGALGFRHQQWVWLSSIQQGQDGEPDIYAYFRVRELTLPLVVLVAAFASYPFIAFVRGPVRRWRRRRKGLGVKCGYNLTGNVSGTCPECGKPI